ncbi:MAG: DNA repair exonuclease [Gemmatimonadaceae bacterium]
MRLIHLSDLHLGFRQYQRTTPAGINQREADIGNVFRQTIDKIIELAPDLVLIAGDIFHNVRPSNPAILHAFTQFSRLAQSLPNTIVVLLAGDHDTPRSAETGCILRLFSPLGIEVADSRERRLTFADRSLSVLAVPHLPGQRVAIEPDPAFEYNILAYHGELQQHMPSWADLERVENALDPKEIGYERWSYVALGHHHVFQHLASNACYSGSMEYASVNIWGELKEEVAAKVKGKKMVEYDLTTGKRTLHEIKPARLVVDLPPIRARALTSAEISAQMRTNVDQCKGGIDDKIVRQLILDVPRHVVRELDHKALREYKRRAVHYHLDPRRPEIARATPSGVAGRRTSLAETVRDKLWSRQLQPDLDRDALIELGLRYLREADQVETAALAVPESE